MTGSRFRANTWATILALAALVPPFATAQAAYQLDVPAQDLSEALRAVGRQTNTNVIFEPSLVKGINAGTLRAELTADQAIQQLLVGTRLAVRRTSADTVVVQREQEPTRIAAASDAAKTSEEAQNKSFWDRFRVAQVTQETPSVSAGGPPERIETLEEIVVTAQKRQERVIDVPISIVALSGEELQKRNITTIDGLALATPGLSVQSNGSTRRILLRGVGNLFGTSPLVGVYLDEASVTSGPFTQLDLRTYDLERVEVLRGPQGTLYGDGSMGGTIRFITHNPELDRAAWSADVAERFTEDGSTGQRVEGMVNVPIVDDVLGLRLGGTYDHGSGWVDQPAAGKKDINDQDLYNVRAKVLWQTISELSVGAMATIHRSDAAPARGEDANGNYTQVFHQTTTPDIEDDYDLYNLTVTYDLPAVEILSTTTYINQDQDSRNVGNSIQQTAPPAVRFDQYVPFLSRTSDIRSEELRFSSRGTGPWEWTFGGLARRAEIESAIPITYFAQPGPVGSPLPTAIPNILSGTLFKQWAVFGDVNYQLTDRFTLGTGLRYFEDDQKNLITQQRRTFTSINPRAYARYKITNNITTYASAAKGFRSGGFNVSTTRPPYDPDSVWTYEFGTKTALLDRRLGLDTALFYSTYKNLQITGRPPGEILARTSNAGKARIRGVEATLTWRPADKWTLGLNSSYADAEFVTINATSASHQPGDPLDGVPKYSFTATAEREFVLSAREGFARIDYGQQGNMTYRLRSTGPWYFSQSNVINMLNFNVGLQWTGNVHLNFYGQNLLDDRGFTDPLDIEGIAARAQPRTYGIEVGVRFD